jgi:GNAT superfamily N-acetyltransferase
VLDRATYLDLYRRVGEPLRWDQRTRMSKLELDTLLASDTCRIYVLRDRFAGTPVGFCEFDRAAFPEVELKNFGLVPEVQGRGLGPWLLATALTAEWADRPRRIWLHTDDWDHPAAVRTYERAGFVTYDVREEPADPL